MSRNQGKRNRSRSHCGSNREVRLLGFILAAFGAITICAFILPVQAWIFLLSAVLLICGIVLLVS